MQHDERKRKRGRSRERYKREVEEVVMNYYIRSHMTSDGVPGMSLLKQTFKIFLLLVLLLFSSLM